MADKTDLLLTNYYSGVLDTNILLRRKELQWQPKNDDNIGGGRAQNKQTRPVDNLIARYEADYILHDLVKQRDAIKRLELTLNDKTKQIVKMRYDRREKLPWATIATKMNLSERTCHRYQKAFKDSAAKAFAELDMEI